MIRGNNINTLQNFNKVPETVYGSGSTFRAPKNVIDLYNEWDGKTSGRQGGLIRDVKTSAFKKYQNKYMDSYNKEKATYDKTLAEKKDSYYRGLDWDKISDNEYNAYMGAGSVNYETGITGEATYISARNRNSNSLYGKQKAVQKDFENSEKAFYQRYTDNNNNWNNYVKTFDSANKWLKDNPNRKTQAYSTLKYGGGLSKDEQVNSDALELLRGSNQDILNNYDIKDYEYNIRNSNNTKSEDWIQEQIKKQQDKLKEEQDSKNTKGSESSGLLSGSSTGLENISLTGSNKIRSNKVKGLLKQEDEYQKTIG